MMTQEQVEIGQITDFFKKLSVAAVKIHADQTLKVGDKIHVLGPHTDIEQVVSSLEVDHKPMTEVGGKSEVGLLVTVPAQEGKRPENIPRKGNTVYRILEK